MKFLRSNSIYIESELWPFLGNVKHRLGWYHLPKTSYPNSEVASLVNAYVVAWLLGMLNTAVPQTLLRPSTTIRTSRTAWNIPGPSGTHRNRNLNAFKTSRTFQILAVSRPELSPETDPFGTKQKLPFRTQLELRDESLKSPGFHCVLLALIATFTHGLDSRASPQSECPPGPSRRHCGWAPSPFLRSQRRPWLMKLASKLCQNVQTTWQSAHVEALWCFMMFRKIYGQFHYTHTQRLTTDYTPKNGFVSDFCWCTIGLLIILLQSSSLFESFSSYATVSHQEYPVICQTLWTYRPNHLGIKDVIPNRCFTPSRKAVSIQFHFLESLVRILWKLWNLCTHIRRKASKKTTKNIAFLQPPTEILEETNRLLSQA